MLALTGHQTKLPPGWPGGDRLAVHATADLSGLGKQVSLGCMRTDPKDTQLDAQAHPARHARLHPRLRPRSHNGPPDRVKYIV